MSDSQGFWSYVHADDTAEGGRISQLARDIASQYELITTESINLFLDKDRIHWGEDWMLKIDESLATVAFFIPVITPRYFQSPQCRRELQFFARRATEIGVKELVLPLHYVNVEQLTSEDANDDLITLIGGFQWEDWRELRFEETSGSAYRKRVAGLASRLAEANRKAEQADISSVITPEQQGTNAGEEPGLIDKLADAETGTSRFVQLLEQSTEAISQIGTLMNSAGESISVADNQGKGFVGRRVIAQKLARDLKTPVDSIAEASNEYVTRLHEIDRGYRAIIELAPSELKENPEFHKEIVGFFRSVLEMAESADKSLDAVEGMIESIHPMEKISRDLRPELRRLRKGLAMMVEGREITNTWVSLIDATELIDDEGDSLKE